jgi:hypothetical protein
LKATWGAKEETMFEPGLDKHEWESQWEQFKDDLETSPADALPEVDRLVEEMLEARGFAIDDPVAVEGDDRDVVTEFLAARETTRRVEDDADDIDPGDIAAAVNGYREIFEYLIEERGAP